jgi:hypothetical protein
MIKNYCPPWILHDMTLLATTFVIISVSTGVKNPAKATEAQ